MTLLSSKRLPFWLLQIGMAFIFLYAGWSSLSRPNDWVGYLPSSLPKILPRLQELTLFSIGELVLGVWLLTGWKLFYSSAIATMLLVGITLANLAILDVTFRDIGLALAALALTLLSKPR